MLCRHLRPASRQITHHVNAHWTSCSARTRLNSTATSIAPTRLVNLFQNTEQQSEAKSTVVNGHVRTVRRQKRIAFAQIDDGTTLQPLQAVFTNPDLAKDLSNGSAVTLTGQWQPSKGKQEQQSHELVVQEMNYIGEHDIESDPIQNKYQTPDYLRSLPHLRPRLPATALLLRFRSEMIKAAADYFHGQGYLQTHPPIITSSDCEGGGEVFTVASPSESQSQPASQVTSIELPQVAESGPVPTSVVPQASSDLYFRSPKYLTVSTQLHLEALAQSVGKVWTLSPTFRAEKSDTARHLSEFYMLEAELAFTKDLDQVMDVVEGLLRTMTQYLKGSKTGSELLAQKDLTRQRAQDPQNASPEDALDRAVLESRWNGVLSENQWPRIRYADAIAFLQDAIKSKGAQFSFNPTFDAGLQAEHEKYLASTLGNGGPIFVTDYPRDQKAFYMLPSEDLDESNPPVACFDLLVPDLCEIVGGSLREHRLKPLLDNMRRHGMVTSEHGRRENDGTPGTDETSVKAAHTLEWYVDLRRYGTVPHGGFGLGFDRWLCYLAGVQNIRDMVAFPRWYGRCDC